MGNCLNCKNKSKIHSNTAQNITQQTEKISTPVLVRTLKVDSPFNHCNLLIWTAKETDFSLLFPNTFYKHQVSPHKEMTFNISSFYAYQTSSPFVIDALVFFISDSDQLSVCKEISNSFPNICIKAIVSELELEDFEGFFKVPRKDLLWKELHEQDQNLAKMLRELFVDIDTDFSNYISFEEFCEAVKQLDPGCSFNTASVIMKEIDKDKDGKISLNEFCYWWKRGRQGKSSLLELTSNWADRIMYLLPKMNKFTENGQINKSKTSKRLSISLTPNYAPKFLMSIKAGKSGKREEILHSVESLLRYNIYEFWVSCMITAENEAKAVQNLQMLADTLNNFQACFFSNSSTTDILDTLKVETCRRGENIFLNMIIDVESLELAGIIKKLDEIEQRLTSPIDDFVSILFKSDLGIKEMLGKANNNFLESLQFGSIEIESEHWSAYCDMINPESDFDLILKKFTKIEGEKIIESSEMAKFEPIHRYVQQFFSPLGQIMTQMHLLREALKVFQGDFKPRLAFYVRYMNLGLELILEGEDLSSLLLN